MAELAELAPHGLVELRVLHREAAQPALQLQLVEVEVLAGGVDEREVVGVVLALPVLDLRRAPALSSPLLSFPSFPFFPFL